VTWQTDSTAFTLDARGAFSSIAWGSVLQAYSLDRSKPRSIAVWSQRAPNMPVPAIPGETVVGSKIALFGCAEKQALETFTNRLGNELKTVVIGQELVRYRSVSADAPWKLLDYIVDANETAPYKP
jgi:hypothetical protein